MKSYKSHHIDVRGFIQHFGGQAEMRRLWEKHGMLLTKGAQDKWVMRSAIPMSRVLEAIQICKARRRPFDFNSFVKISKGDNK
jgi:hypothetical protein